MDICAAFLLKLARTPDKAKRIRLLAACVKVRRTWVEELLWEALADPSESVRTFAVKEILRLPAVRLPTNGWISRLAPHRGICLPGNMPNLRLLQQKVSQWIPTRLHSLGELTKVSGS